MTRDEIIQAIHKERERQERLHPDWHGDQHGLVVLAEEFGEVAKALYELTDVQFVELHPSQETFRAFGVEHAERDLENEIIQVAAVCVRWLENR